MPPSASPRIEGTQTGYSTLADERTVSTPHEPNMFAMPSPHRTPKEELRTRTLPAIHSRFANVLDAVLDSALRFTGDVKRANPGRAMLRRTKSHTAPPSSCIVP